MAFLTGALRFMTTDVRTIKETMVWHDDAYHHLNNIDGCLCNINSMSVCLYLGIHCHLPTSSSQPFIVREK